MLVPGICQAIALARNTTMKLTKTITKATTEYPVTRSKGNVFSDIGFEESEATAMMLRSDLMMQIESMLKERKLNQTQAAELLGVTQSRVSDLLRGKLDKFSLEMLITFVSKLGKKVELLVA
jgi:predicted XRE-type DNA-binding protein